MLNYLKFRGSLVALALLLLAISLPIAASAAQADSIPGAKAQSADQTIISASMANSTTYEASGAEVVNFNEMAAATAEENIAVMLPNHRPSGNNNMSDAMDTADNQPIYPIAYLRQEKVGQGKS